MVLTRSLRWLVHATWLGWVLAAPAPPHGRKLSGPLARHAVADVSDFRLVPGRARVVYLADQDLDQTFELYVRDVARGGAARKLHADLEDGQDVLPGFQIDAQGRNVVFRESNFGNIELHSAPLQGRGPDIVLAFGNVPEFELSPDGTRVVFIRQGSTSPQDLYSAPVDGSEPAVLIVPPALLRSFSFDITPDSAQVVYRVDRSGVFELFRVPIAGGVAPVRLNTLLSSDRDVTDFRISATGGRVVYRADQATNDVFELFTTSLASTTPGVRVSPPLAPGRDVEPEFELSPDGSRMVFLADLAADDVLGLHVTELAAPGIALALDAPLEPARAVRTDFALSPDGARVVYRRGSAGGAADELASAPLDGSAAPVRLDPGALAALGDFEIGADSARVVFLAEPELAGARGLFVAPLDGSAPARELDPGLVAGGDVAGFQLAGNLAVYRADQELDEVVELFAVPLSGGAPHRVHPPLGTGRSVQPTVRLAEGFALYLADPGVDELFELYGAPLDGLLAPRLLSDPAVGRPMPAGDVVGYTVFGGHALYMADAEEDDVVGLYTVPLDGSRPPRRLSPAASVGGVRLALPTPDGRHVVYLADEGSSATRALFHVPFSGGTPVQISELELAGIQTFQLLATPGGPRALYRGVRADGGSELASVPADGNGVSVRLSASAPWTSIVEFEPSPDDAWVVYRADQDVDERYELYSAPSDGSFPAVRLAAPPHRTFGNVLGFRLTPDARHVVFRSDRERRGRFELFSVPIDGRGPPVRLSTLQAPGGDVQRVQLAPDSSRVVYAADQERNDWLALYSVPVDGSQPPVRLGPGSNEIIAAYRITADARRVVFAAGLHPDVTFPPSLQPSLYSVPLDGSAPAIRLYGGRVDDFELSPDGRLVAFVGSDFGAHHAEFLCAPVDGSTPPVRLATGLLSRYDVIFRFSPDSTRLVYQPYFPRGGRGLFSQPALGGPPVELSSFGYALDFSPDGREVLYNSGGLFRVPLDGSAPSTPIHPELAPGRFVRQVRFAPDGSTVYLADQEQEDVNELFVSGGILRPRTTPSPAQPPR